MQVLYATKAKEDRTYGEKTSLKMIQRIDKLIADINNTPFSGLGKPEPLRFTRSGYWSRRITHEHRLVYKIVGNTLYIAQCRFHY